MSTCGQCGNVFDLSHTKRSINIRYGAGTYEDYYPEEDVCLSCAEETISADWGTGAEIKELMGDSWYD